MTTIFLARDRGSGRCKIGSTEDLPMRLKALEKASDHGVKIVASGEGGRTHVAALKRHLNKVNGEWVSLTPKQVESARKIIESGYYPPSHRAWRTVQMARARKIDREKKGYEGLIPRDGRPAASRVKVYRVEPDQGPDSLS